MPIAWRADSDGHWPLIRQSPKPTLELHVVPIGASARSSRLMAGIADVLLTRLRATGAVAASEALSVDRPGGAVSVSVAVQPSTAWNTPKEAQLLGVRLGVDGQLSAWASLPSDSMGAILDPTKLPEQLANLLRIMGSLRVVEAERLAIGVGIDPTMMLSIGRADHLPRQSVTGLSMSDRPVRVVPDELVSEAALDAGALEVGRSLARALVESFETRR